MLMKIEEERRLQEGDDVSREETWLRAIISSTLSSKFSFLSQKSPGTRQNFESFNCLSCLKGMHQVQVRP